MSDFGYYLPPGVTQRQIDKYYGWLEPQPEPDEDRTEEEE